MLDLKAIFDVAEAPADARRYSFDVAADTAPATEGTESAKPDQASPPLDNIRDSPTAGTMNVFRSRSSNPASGRDWPADVAALADFCLLLTADDLPAVPFHLNPWTEVRDAGKMLRSLRADILRGPSGPRARYGALQADLRRLHDFLIR